MAYTKPWLIKPEKLWEWSRQTLIDQELILSTSVCWTFSLTRAIRAFKDYLKFIKNVFNKLLKRVSKMIRSLKFHILKKLTTLSTRDLICLTKMPSLMWFHRISSIEFQNIKRSWTKHYLKRAWGHSTSRSKFSLVWSRATLRDHNLTSSQIREPKRSLTKYNLHILANWINMACLT